MSKLDDKTPAISSFSKSIARAIVRHKTPIMIIAGGVCMISGGCMAVGATPKALKLIEETKKTSHKKELTAVEAVKAAWKCYIPAAAVCGLGVGFLTGAAVSNEKQSTALVAACALSETALKEYKDKVVEKIGEKKEQEVRDSVAKDRVERDPLPAADIISIGSGKSLCYDCISGRYFESTRDIIERAVTLVNQQLYNEMWVPLNDFYYQITSQSPFSIGLPSISIGDSLGWDVEKGWLEISYTSVLAKNGTPCLVMNYGVAPMYH